MKRPAAALFFFGGYLLIAVLLLLINGAAQASQASLIFVLPMLGVLLCTLPANLGFAIGIFTQGAVPSARKCLACAALVAIVVGAIATPIGNLGDFAINAAFLAVFVVCVFLPRLAVPR